MNATVEPTAKQVTRPSVEEAMTPTRTALRVREAASYLGRTKDTLDKWRSDGKGPIYRKVDNSVYYLVADLDDWIMSHPAINPADKNTNTEGTDDK